MTKKQKYLGLIFNCSLSWAHHVTNVCSKMSYYLYLRGSLNHVIDYSLMKMLLESLVLSHLRILLCSSLGSLSWKYFATETSKNAESCSEAVL